MPLISIIVPVYNMERYLRECMDSILCQTVKDLEIICVDDGSKDSSPDILREYSEKDGRIVIISKENTGYGDSMNRGLECATGKFIGIVEPDDFIEPDMFETLLKNAEENDLDVSRCTFLYLEEATGEESKEHYPFMIKDRVYAPRDCPETFFQQPSDWVNLYRKDFLDRNGIRFLPTPGASFQDTSFLFKAYASADRFMITDRQLYHYRINENSSVKQKSSKIYFLCGEYGEMWKFVREKGEYERYRHIIPQLQYFGYKWNCMRLDEEYRMEFIRRWSEEFRRLEDEGNIRHFDYLPSDWRIIRNVIDRCGEFTKSEEFGLIESKDKNTRKMSSRFGFAARWFVRLRNRRR